MMAQHCGTRMENVTEKIKVLHTFVSFLNYRIRLDSRIIKTPYPSWIRENQH